MVSNPNAIIDPQAVMVITFYALIANEAVTRVGCADYLALRAKQERIEVLNEAHERYVSSVLH